MNLFADMGVQPGNLQPGSPPRPRRPTPRADLDDHAPAGGSRPGRSARHDHRHGHRHRRRPVGGVEVSVDGGTTWHPARSRRTGATPGRRARRPALTMRSRAADDSANPGAASAPVDVTVGAATCPCTLWPASATPADARRTTTDPSKSASKFTSDVAGTITGVRFYKGAGNTGTHVGNLWTPTGTLLATATFTGETASGWQQVTLATPVADHRQHHVRRVVLRARRVLRRRHGLLRYQPDTRPSTRLPERPDPTASTVRHDGVPAAKLHGNYWVDVVVRLMTLTWWRRWFRVWWWRGGLVRRRWCGRRMRLRIRRCRSGFRRGCWIRRLAMGRW